MQSVSLKTQNLSHHVNASRIQGIRLKGNVIEFHANTTAMINRMINSRHTPRTNHFGNPANPQIANTAARTPKIRMVIADENMFG
jgi:hypothetical protein